MKYDLRLFLELNEEYREKPLVPAPPSYAPTALAERGKKRADVLVTRIGCVGTRVLEIGCGRGEVGRALADYYGCTTVGVDVVDYKEWGVRNDKVDLRVLDLTNMEDAADRLGRFDAIYSFSVWEHLRHPFSMLKRVRELLKPDGVAYISANLFRGPKASHRYREVYFPWPHLLFQDSVFEEFYESIGKGSRGASWVNRLSTADYMNYFNLLGFGVENVRYSITPIDEPFYARFADLLERYPRYDLERDFIHSTLRLKI